MPRKLPKKLGMWMKVAKEEGYMKKGAAFKPLPKKGTRAYAELKKKVEARM